MKRILTVLSIGLLTTFMCTATSQAMSRVKKCCGDDPSQCCGKAAEKTACCGDDASKCCGKAAAEKAHTH
ncbi:MAG: hypothetical protein KJN67_03430 [Pontiella sp.]|nr:hypothetical protein [Pontiella sp.]MBT8046199.1 hypothetical protein [Pontiella sp.]NNJ70447.1 hypothetical protein [Kiritimatiellales bacterium]